MEAPVIRAVRVRKAKSVGYTRGAKIAARTSRRQHRFSKEKGEKCNSGQDESIDVLLSCLYLIIACWP